MPYFALLDDAVSGRAVLFQDLQYSDRILSDGLDRLDGLLAQGWRRGLHLFLTADYGFGIPLQNLPASESSTLTLHWFADKQNVDADEWLAAREDGSPAGISRPEISRGLYTGSIGHLEPCAGGLGFGGTLNVVIRTLQLSPSPPESGLPPYRAVYGVGSGIVADSDPEGEYRECGWKARFLTELPPEFGLFETMRTEAGRIPLLDDHLGRLKTAAAALNLSLPDDAGQQIRRHLAELPGQGAYRVKAALFSDGLQLSHAPLSDLPPNQSIILSDTALPERDFLRRFKTTHRETLDQGWRQAEAQGAFDSLFFNRAGELLEGGRSSVFVRFGSEWHTPPLELDILDGIMRRQILRQPQQYLGTSRVFESRISRARLMQADEIRLCNALRGLFAVRLK